MHNALRESEGLGDVFESEVQPVEVRSLDPEVVAAIVRRAVDKSKPPKHQTGDEFIEVLMESLVGLEIGDLPAEITRRYFGNLLGRRERWSARSERALRLFRSASDVKTKSPLEIERDAARRQRAANVRRRSNPRRRFPFSFWL
jgi:hypothetical protein